MAVVAVVAVAAVVAVVEAMAAMVAVAVVVVVVVVAMREPGVVGGVGLCPLSRKAALQSLPTARLIFRRTVLPNVRGLFFSAGPTGGLQLTSMESDVFLDRDFSSWSCSIP